MTMKTIKRILLGAFVFLLMGFAAWSYAEQSYPYLELTHLPNQVVYFLGDTMDKTGIEGTLWDSDYMGTSFSAEDFTVTPSSITALFGIGIRQATATVNYEGRTYSAAFDIYVMNAGRTLQDAAGYPIHTGYGYNLTKEKSLKTYSSQGAKALLLQFSEATSTDCCDYIHIADGNGDLIGTYEDNELSGKKLWITGDSFSIWITSDEDDCHSSKDYGYSFDAIWSVNVATCPHLYADPVVTPATCDTDGSSVIECVGCGYTETTVLPKLTDDGKHTYDYEKHPEEIYRPSTAYMDGYYDLYYACLTCGHKNRASGYPGYGGNDAEHGICGQTTGWALLTDGTMVIYRRMEGMSYYNMYCAPGKADRAKALYVQNKLENIYPESFKNCTSLTSVRLPDSLEKIDYDAFFGCSNLTEISFSGVLSEIGDNAFRLCTRLTSVDFGNTSPAVGEYAFAYCDALSTVDFGTGKVAVGECAFDSCPSVDCLDIPAGVTLGRYAFHKCTGLTTMTARCKDIPDSCFESCWALSSVTLENTETIGDYAFGGTDKLYSIVFPSTLTKIEMAFTEQAGHRPALRSATFLAKDTVIATYAFKSVSTAQLTICGPGCSTAAAFAGKMRYAFSPTDQSSHTLVTIPAVTPTCVVEGFTEGSSCTACGYVKTAQVSLGVNDHEISDWVCISDSEHSRRCLTCDTKNETEFHERTAGFCAACGDDALSCTLLGNRLELCLPSGVQEGMTVVAAVYDSAGKMLWCSEGVWESGLTYEIEIPEGAGEVKVFFLSGWRPLRPVPEISRDQGNE